MRRFAIRLAIALAALLVVSQFALPPLAENRVADRITEDGGDASVQLAALPALKLLFGHGDKLEVDAAGLTVDLRPGQEDAFGKLDDFGEVEIIIRASRAGPLRIANFRVRDIAQHRYDVAIAGNGTPSEVARYAGRSFGGALGGLLAGLASSALGDLDRPIPFEATMEITTDAGAPRAVNVQGTVAGFPAGPLAQIVANALLSGL